MAPVGLITQPTQFDSGPRHPMTKRERKTLAEYVRWVADQLELRDWTIHLEHIPCDPERAGEAECVRYRRDIHISVNHRFRDYPPEEQRETIVHELLHAHHEACWRMVQADLAEPLGKIAYYVFCDAYRANMEHCVDALAKALSKHMPLIDWPTR